MAEPTEPEGPACHSYGDGLGVHLPPEVLDQMAAGMNALDRECAEAEVERRPLAEPVPAENLEPRPRLAAFDLFSATMAAMLPEGEQEALRAYHASKGQPEYQPPMNAEERARRAEALGGRLAAAFAPILLDDHEVQSHRREQIAALDAWAEHRARLDAQGVPR